jgi:hypothetical protein
VADVTHGLLIIATLLALLCLPCMLALVIFADVVLDRADGLLRGSAGRWRTRHQAHRLERHTGLDPGLFYRLRHRHAEARAKPAGPPFEELAADLRRLARQRIEVGHRSPIWFNAVHRAYDDRLSLVCRELEIPEQLHELEGLDLEFERLRVESRLEAAGLRLTIADTDHWQDSW